jgi:hypothetical protein
MLTVSLRGLAKSTRQMDQCQRFHLLHVTGNVHGFFPWSQGLAAITVFSINNLNSSGER